jgi:hypothetical protein
VFAELSEGAPAFEFQARSTDRVIATTILHLGSLRITNRDTLVMLMMACLHRRNVFEDAQYALVGDAIFAGSMGKAIGRRLVVSKGPGSNFSLPAATLICRQGLHDR